jgi:hypothetical protein
LGDFFTQLIWPPGKKVNFRQIFGAKIFKIMTSIPDRENEPSLEGGLQQLQDGAALLVVGQEGGAGKPARVIRLARMRVFRALDSGRKLESIF